MKQINNYMTHHLTLTSELGFPVFTACTSFQTCVKKKWYKRLIQ